MVILVPFGIVASFVALVDALSRRFNAAVVTYASPVGVGSGSGVGVTVSFLTDISMVADT